MKPMISKFVGKSKLEECEIFMDVYDGDRVSDKIRLVFGDMYSEKPSDTITMVYGKRVFIPIAFRSDSGNDQNAYIATQRYFNKDEKDKPLQPDRRKHRFKLRLKSGGFERTTEHFYFIRVPNERRNSQFSVEQELFGDGTQGLKDDST